MGVTLRALRGYRHSVRVVLSALVLSLVAGVIAGGRPRALVHLPIRWAPLAIPGALLIVVHATSDRWGSPSIFSSPAWLLAGSALLAVVAIRNAVHYPGLAVAAFGLALNGLVTAANGAMPVDLGAARDAGLEIDASDFPAGSATEPVTPATRFDFLARQIPIDLVAETLSWGDIALALGLAGLVYQAMVEGDENENQVGNHNSAVPVGLIGNDSTRAPHLPPTRPAAVPVLALAPPTSRTVWFGSSRPLQSPPLVGPDPASTVLVLDDDQVGDVFWTEWTRQQGRIALQRRYLIDLTLVPEPPKSALTPPPPPLPPSARTRNHD